MKKHVCRLCGGKNTFGIYCDKCVPSATLRGALNAIKTRKANMHMVDFRARNGLSVVAAGEVSGTYPSIWRDLEINRKARTTKRTAAKIAKAMDMDPKELFSDMAPPPPPPPEPKYKPLPPGVNQKLLAQDSREAAKAGYGNSYGLWRADQERMENHG